MSELSHAVPVFEPHSAELLLKRPHTGAGSLFHHLFGIFNQEAPHLLSDARIALETGDREGCSTAVHSLKGNSASIGASRLAHSCGDLLETCHEGGDLYPQALERLKEELRAFQAEAASYLARRGQG